MDWGILGFWLFVAIVILSPSITSWLKERERQKTLQASIRDDGSIDPEILSYYRQLQADDFANSRKSKIRNVTFEHGVAWFVMSLAFLGGSTVLGVGISISRIDSTDINYWFLLATFVGTFSTWGAGVFLGFKLNKRGGNREPPPLS